MYILFFKYIPPIIGNQSECKVAKPTTALPNHTGEVALVYQELQSIPWPRA